MSNMSYCRFQNTYNDLFDCEECIEDLNLSDRENDYRKKLISLCIRIAQNFDDEDLDAFFAENSDEDDEDEE